jgi:hypothetical protein
MAGGASALEFSPVEDSLLGVVFRNATMAALMSRGHIVLLTYGGTWMSNVKHISMICWGGKRARYCFLSS